MPAEKRRAVLVADDEPLLQRLMTRVLAQDRWDAVVVGDGQAALAALEREPARFAALVLDARLPPAGAAAPLRALLARRPELGVVVTSGGEPGAELEALLAARGGVFLPKPFAPAALADALRRALAQREVA